MSQLDDIADIIDVLQEATFDETLWRTVSAMMDEANGMFSNHLMAVGESPEEPPLFSEALSHGEKLDDVEREYHQDYLPCDERIPRLQRLPYGKLHHNTDILTEREIRQSPTYNDFLPRVGSNNQLCVRLPAADGMDILFAFTHVDATPWSAAQIKFIRELLPHIAHWVRVRQTLGGLNASGNPLAGLLEDLNVGIVALDRKGQVVEANAEASRLLREGNGLYVTDGALRARRSSDDASLRALVGQALTRRETGVSGGSIIVGRPPPISALTVQVNAISPSIGAGRSAVLVMVKSGGSGPADASELSKDLGLTPAEAKVAAALAAGQSVAQIADSTHRSSGTIRWHVRRIFSKLGVHRQADLVRLLLERSQMPQ